MELPTRLAQLEDAQLVRRVPDEELAYLFKHALTQESAYQSLLLKIRREVHRQVAEALEQLYSDRLDEYAGLLAHHYAEAGNLSKTVEYAERAGDAAARVFAEPEARRHYTRALDAIAQLPPSLDLTRKRIDLAVKRQEMSWAIGASEEMLTELGEIEALARTLPGVTGDGPTDDCLRLARIHYTQGSALFARGQLPAALGYFEQVIQEAQGLAEGPMLAIPLELIGGVLMFQGHFRRALPLVEQARALSEPYAHTWFKLGAIVYVALTRAALGDPLASAEELERELDSAQAAGYLAGVSLALTGLASFCYLRGEVERAHDAAARCISHSESNNDLIYALIAFAIKGWADSRMGNLTEARDAVQRAQDLMAQFGGQAFAGDWVAAFCAGTALNIGLIGEAQRLAQGAVAYARSVGGLFAEAIAQRVWAQALAAQNPNDVQVDEHLRVSLDLLQQCEAPPETARTLLAWGKICRARGDDTGACAHFEKAAALFEASGLARESEETSALVNEVALES